MESIRKHLVEPVEKPDPIEPGTGEAHFTFYSVLAFGLFIITRDFSSLSSNPVHENVVNLVFEILLFVPILLIAQEPVSKVMKLWVQRYRGMPVALVPVAVSLAYYAIAVGAGFTTVQDNLLALDGLFIPNTPWMVNLTLALALMVVFFLYGVSVMGARNRKDFLKRAIKEPREHGWFWIMVALAMVGSIPLAYSLGAGVYSYVAPAVIIIFLVLSQVPQFKYSTKGMTVSDLFALLPTGLIVLATQQVRFFQPQVPLALILVALFHAGRESSLGRMHFKYSYAPRASDLLDLVNFVLLSFAIILPVAILIGFIDLGNFRLLDVTFIEVFNNTITWTYYVGISEEIIFRVLLLTLFADFFKHLAKKRIQNGKEPGSIISNPNFSALLTSSLIFGVAHATKGWNYAILAFMAGFAYGLLYLKQRGMFGPIFLHMTVDVIAVTFFQASL